MPVHIPSELLRTFVIMADTRSYTKAAKKLGVSQPSISGQMKRLRGLIGQDILDRSVPGFHLTRRGEEALRMARDIVTSLDNLAAAFATTREELAHGHERAPEKLVVEHAATNAVAAR